ncbi:MULTISPECIES: hypothetical protein [unclassified Streptomyces]|uniref:hypothetical protein n=1 Tax=unclassified Streptomyces TaxID=2593676 RepID=UPI0019D1DB08|nr:MULTISPECIES: hypothetical protein [unclassified Streptomyces]
MSRRKQPVLAAVALCLGGALTACGGGGDGEGFTAVGAGPSPGGAVAPSGAVTLVPLDSPTASGTISSTSSPPPGPDAPPDGPGPSVSPSPSLGTGPGTGASTGTRAGTGSSGSGSGSAPGGRTESGAPPGGGSPGGTPAPPRTPGTTPGTTSPPATAPAPTTAAPRPSTTAPAPGPAVLTVSAPVTADGEKRWCERVTVTFRNTGGSPVASGTASFATHVVGALGIDWGTVVTSQPLPAPIAAGAARKQTYTVCLDSWRVPLGMRVETREVTATWR